MQNANDNEDEDEVGQFKMEHIPKQIEDGKILKRVPKLKSEMDLRNTMAYTHALNVLKVEKSNVCLFLILI